MLTQRRSWPSSFVTGLIGWNGFLIIVALAFGYRTPPTTLALAGTIAAVIQVIALRLLFFVLRLDRNLAYGAVAGVVSGGLALMFVRVLFEPLAAHLVVWLITAVYVGAAVGAFLSYFYRDDRAIEAQAEPGVPVDYGRDGHWLEPFVFGALAYLIVYLPHSWDVGVLIVTVGAMSGVFAAGASHFVLFSTVRNPVLVASVGLITGVVQGVASGFLFRDYVSALWLDPVLSGAAAGVLTYAMTLVRGYRLAQSELAESKRDAGVSVTI